MRYDQVSDSVNGEEDATLATTLAAEHALKDQNKQASSHRRIEASATLYETDDNINLALLGMKQK